MLDKLRQMEENYHAMQEKMMDPDVVGDNQQYAQLMREYKHMQPIMEKYHEYLQAQRDFTEAKELLDSETDPELREMAQAELEQSRAAMETMQEELKRLLLPKDPNDDRNVIIEIRGGAGGQHINKTESAVRITHIPTGLVVECQDERSQYKNKDKAMKILRSRLYERMQQEQNDKIASERRMQVGTGDRSERIRTYNFPQGRMTDHRIGLTLYRLEDIMNGNLDEVFDALATADELARLAGQQEEA